MPYPKRATPAPQQQCRQQQGGDPEADRPERAAAEHVADARGLDEQQHQGRGAEAGSQHRGRALTGDQRLTDLKYRWPARYRASWAALVIVIVGAAIVAPHALSGDSITLVTALAGVLALASFGQVLIVSTGAIDLSISAIVSVAAGIVVLLLVVLRALAAAVEAALVATGQPRALALGAPPGATRRARCLAALARDPEGTGATIRVVETSTVLLAGLMSGTAGVLLFPDRAAFAAGLLAALLGAALSLLLAAVGRGLGAAHGEAVALALAVPVRGLRVVLRPVGQLLALRKLKRSVRPPAARRPRASR